jgi:hypothetical protein
MSAHTADGCGLGEGIPGAVPGALPTLCAMR